MTARTLERMAPSRGNNNTDKISTLALGVRAFTIRHMEQARAAKLDTLRLYDPSPDIDSTIHRLVQDTVIDGMTIEMLEMLGQEAAHRGSVQTPRLVFKTYLPGVWRPVWRHLRRDAKQVDGCQIPRDASEEQRCFLTNIPWRHNSCAFDVVLVMAIQMNLGRLTADQLDLVDEDTQLSRTGQFLRAMLATIPWADATPGELGELRDLFRKEAVDEYPSNLSLTGMNDVAEVIQSVFMGQPATSYHQFEVTVCCDGIETVKCHDRGADPTAGLECISMINIYNMDDGMTLQRFMDETWFGPRADRQLKSTCSQGTACIRARRRRRIILDRLPPFLLVVLPAGYDQNQAVEKNRILDETYIFTYLHATHHGCTRTSRYSPVGAVFWTARPQHYFVRWRRGSTISEFDGLSGNSCARIYTAVSRSGQTDWFAVRSGIDRSEPQIRLVVYEIQ